MSVTKDGHNTAYSGAGTATSLSCNITIATQAHRILLAHVYLGGSATNLVVTFAGAAMTQLCYTDNGSGVRLYTFYLTDPPVGTGSLAASWTESLSSALAGISFYDVNTWSPFLDMESVYKNDTASSLVVDAAASGLAVDVIWKNATGTTLTVGASQTERYRITSDTSAVTYHLAGSTEPKGAGDTVTMSWTLNLSRSIHHHAIFLRVYETPPFIPQVIWF